MAMLAAAVYVLVQAVRALLVMGRPEHDVVGLVLLAFSALVLPGLGWVKLRLAGVLGSAALRGDGVLSAVGAALAVIALVGVGADAWWGWWWTDPVAAALIALFLLREGWRLLRGAGEPRTASAPMVPDEA